MYKKTNDLKAKKGKFLAAAVIICLSMHGVQAKAKLIKIGPKTADRTTAIVSAAEQVEGSTSVVDNKRKGFIGPLRRLIATSLAVSSFLGGMPMTALAEGKATDLGINGRLTVNKESAETRKSPRLSAALKEFQKRNFSLRANRESVNRTNWEIYSHLTSTLSLRYSVGASRKDSYYETLDGSPNFFNNGISNTDSDNLAVALAIPGSLPMDIASSVDRYESAKEEYQYREVMMSSLVVKSFFKYLSATSAEEVYELNTPFPLWLRGLAEQTPDNTFLLSKIDSFIASIDSKKKLAQSDQRKAAVDFLSVVTVKPLDIFDVDIERISPSHDDEDEFDFFDLPMPEVIERSYRRPVEITRTVGALPATKEEALAIAKETSSLLRSKKKLVNAATKDVIGAGLEILLPTFTVSGGTSYSKSETLLSSADNIGTGLTWYVTTDDVFNLFKTAPSNRKSAKIEAEATELAIRVSLENSYIELEAIERQAEIALDNYIQGYAALLELGERLALDEANPDPVIIDELVDIHQNVLDDGIAVRQLYDLYFIVWYNIEAHTHEDLDSIIPVIQEIEKRLVEEAGF